MRRVRLIALGAWLVFGVFLLIFGGFRHVVGLTCSAAVTMISFLWLEEIVRTVLHPSAKPNPARVTARAVSRLLMLGVALLVTILVARFDALSVLLGFSIVVVGIIGEALYWTVRRIAKI